MLDPATPPPALVQWLAVLQPVLVIVCIPFLKMLMGMSRDVRETKQILVGTPEARALGLVAKVESMNERQDRVEQELNKVYGVLRVSHPIPAERVTRSAPRG